jgi:hypothetical protein
VADVTSGLSLTPPQEKNVSVIAHMYTKILTLVDCSANSVENGEVQKHREFKSLKVFMIIDFIDSYK